MKTAKDFELKLDNKLEELDDKVPITKRTPADGSVPIIAPGKPAGKKEPAPKRELSVTTTEDPETESGDQKGNKNIVVFGGVTLAVLVAAGIYMKTMK
ncbi:MAG: hypothetical protein ACQETE_01610 [Bacteroidota bacterium]